MTDRYWILGASDPEMAAIEKLLIECGEKTVIAMHGGARVFPGNAYNVDGVANYAIGDAQLIFVECSSTCRPSDLRVDHHRVGDPGFGRPAFAFMSASSIGQTIRLLAQFGVLPASWPVYAPGSNHLPGIIKSSNIGWCVVTDKQEFVVIPSELVLTAAADHCLSAAYRGECFHVDPDTLMAWRVASRAEFQQRPQEEVLADITAAREVLKTAPLIELAPGIQVADMRVPQIGWKDVETLQIFGMVGRVKPTWVPYYARTVSELVEAAARDNTPFISGPLVSTTGQVKITCKGGKEVITAFLRNWAPTNGVIDTYGDPERGFARGYLRV